MPIQLQLGRLRGQNLDSQVCHANESLPAVILKTGHTLLAKYVEEKAEACIFSGRGKIRCVFTLELHGNSQAVDLATWTPESVHEGKVTVKAKSAYQVCHGSPGNDQSYIDSLHTN